MLQVISLSLSRLGAHNIHKDPDKLQNVKTRYFCNVNSGI